MARVLVILAVVVVLGITVQQTSTMGHRSRYKRQHNLGLQCPPTLDTPRQQLYCRPARRPDLFGCEDTNNTICVTDDNCEQCQVCCPSPRPRFSMEDGNRTGHCIRLPAVHREKFFWGCGRPEEYIYVERNRTLQETFSGAFNLSLVSEESTVGNVMVELVVYWSTDPHTCSSDWKTSSIHARIQQGLNANDTTCTQLYTEQRILRSNAMLTFDIGGDSNITSNLPPNCKSGCLIIVAKTSVNNDSICTDSSMTNRSRLYLIGHRYLHRHDAEHGCNPPPTTYDISVNITPSDNTCGTEGCQARLNQTYDPTTDTWTLCGLHNITTRVVVSYNGSRPLDTAMDGVKYTLPFQLVIFVRDHLRDLKKCCLSRRRPALVDVILIVNLTERLDNSVGWQLIVPPCVTLPRPLCIFPKNTGNCRVNFVASFSPWRRVDLVWTNNVAFIKAWVSLENYGPLMTSGMTVTSAHCGFGHSALVTTWHLTLNSTSDGYMHTSGQLRFLQYQPALDRTIILSPSDVCQVSAPVLCQIISEVVRQTLVLNETCGLASDLMMDSNSRVQLTQLARKCVSDLTFEINPWDDICCLNMKKLAKEAAKTRYVEDTCLDLISLIDTVSDDPGHAGCMVCAWLRYVLDEGGNPGLCTSFNCSAERCKTQWICNFMRQNRHVLGLEYCHLFNNRRKGKGKAKGRPHDEDHDDDDDDDGEDHDDDGDEDHDDDDHPSSPDSESSCPQCCLGEDDEGLCKLCVPKAGSTGRGRRYLPRRQSLDGDEKSEAERLSEAPTGRPAGQSTRRPQRKPGQTRRRNEKGSKTKKKTKKPKRPKKPSQKKPSVGEAQCWQHNIEKECRSCDQVYYYRVEKQSDGTPALMVGTQDLRIINQSECHVCWRLVIVSNCSECKDPQGPCNGQEDDVNNGFYPEENDTTGPPPNTVGQATEATGGGPAEEDDDTTRPSPTRGTQPEPGTSPSPTRGTQPGRRRGRGGGRGRGK